MCFIGHEPGADQDSHVLCVPRRGFPRFAIPESRRPFSYLGTKTRHRGDPGHPRSVEGKNNRLVARFHSPTWREIGGYYLLHPRPTRKPFEDRRNHENSTLNIFARQMTAMLKLAFFFRIDYVINFYLPIPLYLDFSLLIYFICGNLR